jgi:hypothetical protein
MENQGQRRIWKPKRDYKSRNPSNFGKSVFLPKDFKKKFDDQVESVEKDDVSENGKDKKEKN